MYLLRCGALILVYIFLKGVGALHLSPSFSSDHASNDTATSKAYGLFSTAGLAKAMDQRIRLLHHQRQRLVMIHVHVPKAGGTALAYALASSCNCSQKHTLAKDTASVCTDCRRVLVRHRSLPGWVRFPCTYSRVTGWPCGVAHAPLALLRLLPYCTAEHTIEQRGKPVYVIMLRDPWKRFVSEWRSWGGYRFNTLDWSAVALPDKTTTFPFFNNSRVAIHPQVTKPAGERATLEETISVPANFIIHNRYTKMIGGEMSNFDFNYTRETIGSRWVGASTTDDPNLKADHERALHHLQRSPTVLPLLQERFAESLCVLEILVGSLQKFAWEDKSHAHGAGYVRKDQERLASPRFEDWRIKNLADLQLYNETQAIFDMLLTRALIFLKDKERALKGPSRIAQEQPHCVELKEWQALQQRE